MKKTANKSTDQFDRIMVIGTSAGGLQALSRFIVQIPENFPFPILIVQHVSAEATGRVLLELLNKQGKLTCHYAENNMKIKVGSIYIAPSDHHLMIEKPGYLLITKGATENRFRPAIDPLFRSAAVAYGNKVIGILLTGYLDDGTSGLMAIQRCGGICIIQDPKDADYPDMPLNALNQMKPDYCVPINEMGSLLFKIISKKTGKQAPIPKDIIQETIIAERVLSDLPSVNSLGEQVPFNCPGCGGVLWEIKKGSFKRYRCHTGHAYTAASLLEEQTKKIEETMWTALRMFEERRNLLTTISKQGNNASSKNAKERAELSQVHINRIRAFLLADDQ